MTKKGTRVGAILYSTEKEVGFLGYGTYVGDEIPPLEVGGLLHTAGIPNPKIELDSGKVVWGIECWWGDADIIKAKIAQSTQKIKNIDIDEFRQKESQDGN